MSTLPILRCVRIALAVPLAVVLLGDAVGARAGEADREDDPTTGLVALDVVTPKVELAPPMGELQRLTHKLSLSIGGGDLDLVSFYAYESLELLREIQRDIPQYDGQPIALLIDRMAMPVYERLTSALVAAKTAPSPARSAEVGRVVAGVVDACNGCHEATNHAFIRVRDERTRNPFNQDFGHR